MGVSVIFLCICHVFAARVDTESMDFDENEVKTKKWFSKASVLKMLKNNETKDGVSILALLFAFAFYQENKNRMRVTTQTQ